MSRRSTFFAAGAVASCLAAALAFWAVGDHGSNSTATHTTATPSVPPTATAPPSSVPPPIVAPPGATLRTADGREVVAGIGTRCWANVCLDYVAPISNATPFALPPEGRFEVQFAAGPPTNVAEAWIPLTAAQTLQPGPDGLAWPGLGPPPPTTPYDKDRLPTPPGRYLWVVQAFWQGRGDISYAFYVAVPAWTLAACRDLAAECE